MGCLDCREIDPHVVVNHEYHLIFLCRRFLKNRKTFGIALHPGNKPVACLGVPFFQSHPYILNKILTGRPYLIRFDEQLLWCKLAYFRCSFGGLRAG